MRVDYSMFEGFRVKGSAERVFSRGVLIVDGSQWLGKPGRGAFIRRDTHAGAWS